MSIESQSSNVSSDVRCAVCGQGFLVYAGREGSAHRAELRDAVQQVLRRQHECDAHPMGPFVVELDLVH